MRSHLLCLVALMSAAVATSPPLQVSIRNTASHPIPKTMWGLMHEEINHSGDGGLYAELLQNRAFQQVNVSDQASALYAWHPIGAASLSVITDPKPISTVLPQALAVKIPTGSNGQVGVSNEGYWGIKVDSSWTYKVSFYYKSTPPTPPTPPALPAPPGPPAPPTKKIPAKVSLVSATGSDTYGSTTITLNPTAEWQKIETTIKPSRSAKTGANRFTLSFDASSAPGATLVFGAFSLFPPTFKGRENGLRIDLAETLAAITPGYFRMPGGANLDGLTADSYYKWNNTVGPIINRPGRHGIWGYINTDGLGLYEYLLFCEDVGMEPLLAINDGLILSSPSYSSVPEDQLDVLIQEAIAEIEFIIGDAKTTTGGKLRAKLGHPQPFNLRTVEVGNEDWFQPDSYIAYRWRAFYTKLKATYPQLTWMATTYPPDPVLKDPNPIYAPPTPLTPAPKVWDWHHYDVPSWFVENAMMWDKVARDGNTYIVGEFAAISTNKTNRFGSIAEGRLPYPTVESAIGEAAYMTGLERNADIIFSAMYAPIMAHVNGTQWTPCFLNYDATNVYASPSYHVQKLFGTNKGTEYLPSTLPSSNSTVHWSVVRSKPTNTIIIKVVNAGDNSQALKFTLPVDHCDPQATATVLTGPKTAMNSPETPQAVQPTTKKIPVAKDLSYTAPAWSLTVISINTH